MFELLLSPIAIAAGCVLLFLGGEMLVSASTFIANRIGMSTIAIGATVVAIGTSAPEFSVSFGAALNGYTNVSVGNVVGSNVCNIILVLGLCGLFCRLRASRQIYVLDFPVLIVVSGLFTWMVRDRLITHLEGLILAAGLVGYVVWNLRRAAEDKQVEEFLTGEVAEALGEDTEHWLRPTLKAVGGIFSLALGAKWLVEGSLDALAPLELSEAAVGATVVALGTSLPEIGTSIIATRKGQGDLAVGNAIGSCVFNLLGVLGITASIHPLPTPDVSLLDGALLMAVSLAGLVLLARPGGIARPQGIVLVSTYLLYLVGEVAFQG
ncbi:MAG: calcium/sodium antiporter [bacterium]